MPTPVRHPHRKPKTFGRTAIAAGVAALGLGGALLAAWLRRAPANPAEHAAPALAPAPACCCPRYALLPVQVRAQVPGRRAAHTKSMARGREPGQESGGPGGGLRFDWREEPCGGPCRPGRSSRRRAPALE